MALQLFLMQNHQVFGTCARDGPASLVFHPQPSRHVIRSGLPTLKACVGVVLYSSGFPIAPCRTAPPPETPSWAHPTYQVNPRPCQVLFWSM